MRYTVHGVLAGAYSKLDKCLTHLSTDGSNALCKRVKPDHLCDLEEEGPPTCPACARLAAKLEPKDFL